tara:strand:+ start:6804 stop:7382 length:579 start_codon:yes stop_codon:yes gene_type:complete
MIGTTKQQTEKLGATIVKLAMINLGASKTIEGKKRVTDSTGELRNSLGYRVKQNRTSTGQFSDGFKIEFTSSVDYAMFIEQGVRGSQASPIGAKDSPFKFKKKNVAKGVMASWISNKPIRLRDQGTGKFSKNTEKAKQQLAFLLGRKVATQGIAPRHYFKEAAEQAVPKEGGEVAVAMALDWINNSLKNKLK